MYRIKMNNSEASGNNLTKLVFVVCCKAAIYENLGTDFSGACTIKICGRDFGHL